MNTAHNARVQLLATLLNNIAVAFIVAGFVAPVVTSPLPAAGYLPAMAWVGLGAALHFVAQLVLGRLR